MNPIIEEVMWGEVQKLYEAGIIFPIRHSSWVANLVPMRKKNDTICLCIDYRNLNRESLKDNYPLPQMEQLLQVVSGAKMMSLLDGFSGYNQVLVAEEDQHKTAFTII